MTLYGLISEQGIVDVDVGVYVLDPSFATLICGQSL